MFSASLSAAGSTLRAHSQRDRTAHAGIVAEGGRHDERVSCVYFERRRRDVAVQHLAVVTAQAREELGLAYYVGAQTFSALSCGAFYFYVGTAPHQLDQAEAEMTILIKDLAEKSLSPDELDRARTTWKSSWLRSQQGNGPMADVTGWNELNGLGHDHYQRLPSLMAAVTPADIQAAARTYLHPKKAFIVRVTRR